jgi:2-polyprenyl-6-methoxyphenol hydroxylase-like FAD-dependent oxidoreductase
MQQQRQERIELETQRHRITGDVTLAANGFRSRVSDLLNATEREFVAVSRQHIVFVTPLTAE